MPTEHQGCVRHLKAEPTWFAGAWIGLTLSTLATTAALMGAGVALSTAGLRPDDTETGGPEVVS